MLKYLVIYTKIIHLRNFFDYGSRASKESAVVGCKSK